MWPVPVVWLACIYTGVSVFQQRLGQYGGSCLKNGRLLKVSNSQPTRGHSLLKDGPNHSNLCVPCKRKGCLCFFQDDGHADPEATDVM